MFGRVYYMPRIMLGASSDIDALNPQNEREREREILKLRKTAT